MAIVAWVSAGALPSASASDVVLLSSDGRSTMKVVVAERSTPRTRAAAQSLAAMLERITEASFVVQPGGDDDSGVVVGTVGDFPNLAGELPTVPREDQREEYRLRSHARGVWLIGTTDLAVEHAVWDLLHRIGYRQFFPGPTWEIVPRERELSVSVDVTSRPSFHARSIWYGYGPWDHAREPYEDWCRKNRATKGIELDTGHSYERIHARYRSVFAEHPEYLALVDGERKSDKFCISNAGLRKLIVEDALDHFAKHPHGDSLSVEPSDGLGWCECAECVKLGSPSDRAVLLANEVATAVSVVHPGRRFGMYAYGGHVAPPQRDLHPNLVVSVATAFGSAGLTLDDLMRGWRARGATLGVREYYGVHPWDRDLPGAARGADLAYLARTIPHFHRQGARFFSAESSDNWGPNGFGYYLAARLLWDVNQATSERIAALRNDFLNRAFGPAHESMDRFYRTIDGTNRPLLSEDLIGRMYRALADARRQAEGRTSVLARLDALVLYTHYVERWSAYTNAAGTARQTEFERLIRHAYRMRGTMLVHTLGLYRDLPTRDKLVRVPVEAEWDVPEGRNPWKSSQPFATAEIESFLSEGIARNRLLDFEAVSFSEDLVPATPLKLEEVNAGQYGLFFRNEFDLHTWIESAPSDLSFRVKAGLIYGRLGDAKFSLFPRDEPQGLAVAQQAVPPDKQPREVSLRSPIRGLQRLHLSDGGDGTEVTWPAGTPLTIRSDPANPVLLHGRWTLYFYVPRGTKVLGGFADGPGELRDPHGKTVHKFDDTPAYFHIPVPQDDAGKLWCFHHGNGRRLLMTVPPYLARSERELLLPREIVERDGERH